MDISTKSWLFHRIFHEEHHVTCKLLILSLLHLFLFISMVVISSLQVYTCTSIHTIRLHFETGKVQRTSTALGSCKTLERIFQLRINNKFVQNLKIRSSNKIILEESEFNLTKFFKKL